MKRFEVNKSDLSKGRIVQDELKVADNEILVSIDRFALTANNISYGVVGGKIGYWKFFPAEGEFGVIPVWGVATVSQSNCDGIAVGERIYGYFPMGDQLVMQPAKVSERRFIDGVEHRSSLPPVYNSYARLSVEPENSVELDDLRCLLMPLYFTSFCLQDFFLDNDYFGAEQILVPSASSKTAIGVGYAFKDVEGAPKLIGMTSAGNVDWVKGLGLYDSVMSYDEVAALDTGKKTAIIDMSGNGKLLSSLHQVLGENMTYTCNVGLTHWDANQMGEGFIKERSAMFFAPGHIQKRTAEWGPGVFDTKAYGFWRAAAEESKAWLTVRHVEGLEATQSEFSDMLGGKVDAKVGLIIVP